MNDLGQETIRSKFDRSKENPSIAIVEAIGAIENVPPTDLTQRLHDYIDPEALNELIESSNDISVSFSVDQYQIRVTEDTVEVTL